MKKKSKKSGNSFSTKRLLRYQLLKEAKLVGKNSMLVLKEFERLEEDII